MDFQNRAGGKTGTYGIASASSEAIERRERLRKLALESIDLQKDPYYFRNHVGQVECESPSYAAMDLELQCLPRALWPRPRVTFRVSPGCRPPLLDHPSE